MWNQSLRNFSATGVLVLLVLALTTPWLEPATVEVKPAAPLYRERVLQLPEDAGVWHTTVVYPEKTPSDAASRRLAAALVADERLRSLIAQTHTHVYSLHDPLWQQRLQKHYGVAAPAIIVQQPDGQVCYKASGANLPTDPSLLADEIAQSLSQCRPKPTPSPQPTPQPQPALIPDLNTRTPANESDDSHLLWLVTLPILAGLGGLYQEWKQSNA
ncbi:MAG TPA: hypothetical protein VL096_00810 [Pirellulaceae bacterium]|nr:hypothetical protein [Pirellulaceae bacterium]